MSSTCARTTASCWSDQRFETRDGSVWEYYTVYALTASSFVSASVFDLDDLDAAVTEFERLTTTHRAAASVDSRDLERCESGTGTIVRGAAPARPRRGISGSSIPTSASWFDVRPPSARKAAPRNGATRSPGGSARTSQDSRSEPMPLARTRSASVNCASRPRPATNGDSDTSSRPAMACSSG